MQPQTQVSAVETIRGLIEPFPFILGLELTAFYFNYNNSTVLYNKRFKKPTDMLFAAKSLSQNVMSTRSMAAQRCFST